MGSPPTFPPEQDGWCVRNAVCELMGWGLGSPEFLAFHEELSRDDADRLFDHLGLVRFEFDGDDREGALEAYKSSFDHPGLAMWACPAAEMSHCTYQPHLQHGQRLGPEHLAMGEWVLFEVVADPTQMAHVERCAGCRLPS